MDPLVFLETEDDLKRLIMTNIARRYRDHRERIDKNLAAMISNAVWGAVKKK